MSAVNAFNKIYNKLSGEHHSGWSDDQLKEHTRELFDQNRKKTFQLRAYVGSFEKRPKVESKHSSIDIVKKSKKQREWCLRKLIKCENQR